MNNTNYEERLAVFMNSRYRDDILIGVMKDRDVFRYIQDMFIAVINSDMTDTKKIEVIKTFLK